MNRSWISLSGICTTLRQSAAVGVAITLLSAHLSAQDATLEFRYEFDTTEAPLVDSTGNHANLGLGANGVEHRFGEGSLVGGDGSSIGLDAPGDGHPTGSYLVVPEAPQPDSFSVSLWMKPLLTGTTQAIVARDNVWWPSPCAYYCVYIDELQSLVMKTGGTEAIITEDAIIEDEELYHLVISHLDTDGPDTGNAERSRIYLNGEMVGEMEEPEEIPSLDSIADGNGIFDLLWVGTMTSFGGFWGEMDDLQFYNGELTEEQVAELYANPGSAIGATAGLPGDFNGNGELDLDDINALTAQTASGANVADFDMNSDALVNRDDINVWLDEKNTWIGDSNLDGEFNSTDFVAVFTANEYEDAVDGNSNWSEGDWNGDGDFTSTDFVAAFSSGGYEQGVRPVAAVPEPSSIALTIFGLIALTAIRRR